MSSRLVYCKNCKSRTKDTSRKVSEWIDRYDRVYTISTCGVCGRLKKEFIGHLMKLHACDNCNRYTKSIGVETTNDIAIHGLPIAKCRCSICGEKRKLVVYKDGRLELYQKKYYC